MENANKKILLILTGGTICSEYHGRVKKQGGAAATELEHSFRESGSPFARLVDFIPTENLGIFSENMTVEKWNLILNTLRGNPYFMAAAVKSGAYPSLENEKFKEEDVPDGVIIAHGTDSLSYSAALFSCLFGDLGIPVFLVSSNEALSSDKSNGRANFRAATELICRGIPGGVYVTYRNSDKKTYLHRASRLRRCQNFSEDFFSDGMTALLPCGRYDDLPADYPSEKTDPFGDFTLRGKIAVLHPYPGLDYGFINLDGVDAVIHGTYHSGTVCSLTDRNAKDFSSSIVSLLEKCGDVPVYISPADVGGNIYETVLDVANAKKTGLFFVNSPTEEILYARLLVSLSCGRKGL